MHSKQVKLDTAVGNGKKVGLAISAALHKRGVAHREERGERCEASVTGVLIQPGESQIWAKMRPGHVRLSRADARADADDELTS